MKKISIALFALFLTTVSCESDLEGEAFNQTTFPSEVTVQNFMWRAMNLWYFWQDEVPDLADDRFDTQEEFIAYLQATPAPDDFIRSILFQEDRFTFFNEDFEVLLNSLAGISTSNGIEFFSVDLSADNSETDRYLFVFNVIPGSNGEALGVQRGDVFWGVGGQQFTSANVGDLLRPETYTLNRGELDIANRLVLQTDEEITVTKEENLQENPIRLSTTLDVNGTQVGYLMYQSFNRNFNTELNDVFGEFVANGVTELVLDMRYNGGGSVNTSRLLASMIYGPNTNDLYIRQLWNSKLQNQFSDEQLNDFFANQVSEGVSLNSLNLSRVYVIGTGRTASASELVMNGLDPYIEVIHIGSTTTGKNEFSISLVDNPARNYQYSPSTESEINPNNSWIVQPLVGRNENSVGFFDYTDGFDPDIEQLEDVFNLGTFGDPNEPLLAIALNLIAGPATSKEPFRQRLNVLPNETYEFLEPVKGSMILDKPLDFN